MSFTMYAPTRVLFGAGRLNDLHKELLPGKKALLVISDGKSTRENGYLARTEAQLAAAGVDWALFDKVQSNPLKSTVMAGAAAARENGCDFILALGGGSVMDAAKAMAAMATNPGDLWDYISGGTGGGKALVHTPLPVVCITTTAGTGSEVDEWGVVTNPDTREKMGFGGDPRLFPVLSVVDPELMRTVPPAYTAYQGFDALFHSTEVFISRFANPMSDMIALTAIEKVSRNLAAAVEKGDDLDAREQVAFGNTLSGYAMVVSSTTSEHSLEHAMSAYHQNLPHGAGLIMISKAYYSHFIERDACPERFIRMARAMGKTDADRPTDFLDTLDRLQQSCGVGNLRMSDYGIQPSTFASMAQNAMDTMGGLFTADPISLTHADCVNIYRKSYR